MSQFHPSHRQPCYGLLGAAVMIAASFAFAARGEEPAAQPQQSAVLTQLSHETQSLYTHVQAGVVRLQLPTPKWLNDLAAADDPVNKWGQQLSPAVKQGLIRQRKAVEEGVAYPRIFPRVIAATQPKGGADVPAWQFEQGTLNGTLIIQSTGSNAPTAIQIRTGGEMDATGELQPSGNAVMSFQAVGGFAPNNVGLVVDDVGHVLVPLYLERETVGEGVKVAVGTNNIVTRATFVASDRPSNLTVFQLPDAAGHPIKAAPSKPADGSMVMLLAPNAGTAKLMLWAGEKSDLMGVVCSVDGGVNGFARGNGQFLAASACKPVVDQLIQYGHVKRAALGVVVMQIGPSDTAREQWPLLGNHPGLRVQEVNAGGAADKAGLRKGDVLLSLGDQEVGDPSSLASALAGRAGPTPIKLLRNGEPVDVHVDLKLSE